MDEERVIIPIGPQHPALKEPMNFMLKVEGEKVLEAIPNLGYNHRGIEKAATVRTYIQNLYLAERICGICSIAHVQCYAQGVEKLLEMEIPPRAQYVRLILSELNRLHSHLLWVGVAAHEIGFDTLFMYLWRDREIVMDTLELITGNRVSYGFTMLGGVRRDISPDMAARVKKEMKTVRDRTQYYKKMSSNERSILKRTQGVGILKPQDALALCACGPTLRASNIKWDVRREDPYLAYNEIPFNVVTSDGCDVLSRMIVHYDEVIEATNIIEYALDHMPSGSFREKVTRRIPAGEVVSRVEAPRGEDIHYIKSNGTDKPERFKVRAPTLGNIPAVCKMLSDSYIADVPIILAGIDPCFSCTDRVTFVKGEMGKGWIWTQEELRRYANRWYQQR
ncbi:MAG TPA: nickel-dependent hydrogenase large subunit [Candidatus Bathyarchaeia archaeon]|nr:MAG: NADH dehydrogenase [Candidatus Bathyarchaeota archaeon RBG_16_48_13]HJX24338.1 nickel-dependent hydrogenase large subunit [Candidatus Bathyarchaeia archaeon]